MSLFFHPDTINQTSLKRLTDQAISNIQSVLVFEADRVDIYFAHTPELTPINQETMTAVTYESGIILVKLLMPNYSEPELKSLLYHELNHTQRNQLFSTEQHPTLFNWMLLEGLATSFEKWAMNEFEKTKAFNIPTQTESDQRLLQGLSEIIKIDQSNANWDHYDWFYNLDRVANMPINFAYQIGDFLIKQYCQHYQITPAQASIIPNETFLNFAKKLCAN